MPELTNKQTGVTVSVSEAVAAGLGQVWVTESSKPAAKPTSRKSRTKNN